MKKLVLLCSLLCLNTFLFAQERMVTGNVTDETGQGLPGTNVLIKDSSQGTVTDIEGNFKINIEGDNAILVFSSVGYVTEEVTVGNQSAINIAMIPDITALEEIVVVGYGAVKKESLTAAIANISNDEIQTTTSTSMAQKLSGKIAGLQIRQTSGQPGDFGNDINIRGFGEPIYVIDGIRRGGSSDFQQLNAEDIESISVLKDAAAAIYGLGAANGVILVTTKKGRKEKPSFTYSSVVGSNVPTNMPEMATAAQYTQMWNDTQLFVPGGSGTPYYSPEEIENWKNGGPGYESTDWADLSIKNSALTMQHNLSATGGTEKTQYFVSFGYAREDGLLKSEDMGYKRYNLRSNITTEFTNNLTGELLIGGRWDKSWQPGSGFFNIFKGSRTTLPTQRPYANDNPDYIAQVSSGYPILALMERDISGYGESVNRKINSQFALTYDAPFLEGLSFKGVVAYTLTNYQGKSVAPPYNLYNYDEVNDEYIAQKQRDGTASISNGNSNSDALTLQGYITYKKVFGEKHDLGVTAVVEKNNWFQRRSDIKRYYANFYTKDQLRFADVLGQESDGIEAETADLSYIGRINYAYDRKYLVELAGRYMGTYRYSPENRYGFYPMASVGWLMSEEGFIKNNASVISNLKLRASYGVSAMPEGDAFQYIPGYSIGSGGSWEFIDGELTNGISTPAPANNNLTWMTATTADIGLDIGLWKNKIGFTTDIYERLLEGIPALRSISLPNTYGGELPQENLNSEISQGVEFTLSYNDEFSNGFQFGVFANFSYARTKYGHVEGEAFTNSMDRWRNQKADRWNDISWGYNYIGQFQSVEELRDAPMQNGDRSNVLRELPGDFRYEDANNDGVVNSQDMLPLFYGTKDENLSRSNRYNRGGSPKMYYGLGLNGAYKGFYFNMLFQGAAQYTVRFKEVYAEMFAFRGNTPAYFYDRWTKEDPYNLDSEWVPGTWPANRTIGDVGMMYAESSVWRRDASYVRLKSLEFGYNIKSEKLYDILRIQNLRVYANGFNLFTIADDFVKPFDPEKIEGRYSAGFSYPVTKTYNLGLVVNF